MAEKTRVAVLYGGRSTEHNISCISAGAVMSHLDKELFDVIAVGITKDGRWCIGVDDPAELTAEGRELPEVAFTKELTLSVDPEHRGEFRLGDGSVFATADVIFPVLHGPFGEDGTIQGFFELSGVPYVGTGVLSSACCMDKEYTKKLLVAAGLPVSDGVVVRSKNFYSDDLTEATRTRLGLPVFVKPARGGSSIGISRVQDWAELSAAVQLAGDEDTQGKVLIEAELNGAEVEVGVLERADGRLETSVPARLLGTEESVEGFYGFEAKYLDDVVRAEVPASFDERLTARIQDMSRMAFDALNCRGIARVDFFVTADGPVINEINTMPGFTPISMYPKVFAATGVSYPDLLSALVETALNFSKR